MMLILAVLREDRREYAAAIQGERYQNGNNRGGINGWITRRQIFGRLVAVD